MILFQSIGSRELIVLRIFVMGVVYMVILPLVMYCAAFVRYTILKPQVILTKKLSQKQAELASLKEQINPHFLFNAMNTLYADSGATRTLRQRGPQPALRDSEVLTLEAVGAFLGLAEDKALLAYFQTHYAHFFPALRSLCRTSFTRQAANLWKVKEGLWQHLVAQVPHDPRFTLVDSFALPVCRFARAPRCRRLREHAAFGHDPVARQTFWGLRVHALVAWPGVIVRLALAPADRSELEALQDMAGGLTGVVLGDRNYWSPKKASVLAPQGVCLQAPYKSRKREPRPRLSALTSRLRYRIDTVFGQLCERFAVKRVWARDAWHLVSRLTRVALSHTLMVLINRSLGNEPLQFEHLLTTAG